MSVAPPSTPLRAAARLLAPLLALAAAPGCGVGDGEAESVGGPPAPSVEVMQVAAALLRDAATFSGQLSAENSVVVKPETSGVVEEILFEEGHDAVADQVLIRLRSQEQEARVRESKANLALAREVYDRTHQLATKRAASRAAQDEASAQLAVAEARLELAEVELERTRIRAPFDGVLGMRLVAPGDRVDDDTPLVQIDAVDRLQVSFAISELGILFTRVGAPVEVRVAPYPNEVFPGEVFFVSPTLDPATRRIVAKAWVPNADRRLRAGLFASVDMEIDRRENAIRVPESAIVFDRQGTYVWKLDAEDRASRVPVQVGLRQGGRVEVSLGLLPGDRIVTAGTHKVQEGKQVAVAAPHPPPAGQAQSEPPAGVGEGT